LALRERIDDETLKKSSTVYVSDTSLPPNFRLRLPRLRPIRFHRRRDSVLLFRRHRACACSRVREAEWIGSTVSA